MTNGQAIHHGLVPCETEPLKGGLARTTDVFHGSAEVTVGQHLSSTARRVCSRCLSRHHSGAKVLSRRVRFPRDERRNES